MNFRQPFRAKTVLLLLVILGACGLDEIDSDIKVPDNTSTFGMIVGTASFTLEELIIELEDSDIEIVENNAGLLSVKYSDSSRFSNIDDIVTPQDVSNNSTISPGIGIPTSPIATQRQFEQDLSFEYPISSNEEQLDSIVYSAGTLSFNVSSSFDVEVDYEFVMDEIINRATGEPITISGTLTPGGNSSSTHDLTNHTTIARWIDGDPDDPENNDRNEFYGSFSGTLNIEVGDEVTDDQELSYTVDITGIEFQTIYGYFGEKNVTLSNQTIGLDFFEGISENGVRFENPQLTVESNSAFGVPFTMNLDGFSSTSPSGTVTNLTHEISAGSRTIRAVSIDQVGSTARSSTTINSENSNFPDLMAVSPTELNLGLSGTTNFEVAEPEAIENRNFVDQSSYIDVLTELEMPFSVQMTGFNRNFDYGLDSADVKDADTIRLRIRSINYMPFEGSVVLQILGASNEVLYEEPNLSLIKAPVIESSGRVETPADTTVVIPLYDDGLVAFESANSLNLNMTFNSINVSEGEYVRFFADYTLDFKISLEADISSDLDP